MDILIPSAGDIFSGDLPKKTDLATILSMSSKEGDFWVNPHTASKQEAYVMTSKDSFQQQKPRSKASVVPMMKKEDAQSLGVDSNEDEFEYGVYPQTIVGDIMVITVLEDAYESGQLNETGRIYTFEDPDAKGGFQGMICPEYEYDGESYIRITAPKNVPSALKTENDWVISPLENYWIKVDPIVWEKSKESGNFIASRQLIGGVTFDAQDLSSCHRFEDTDIFRYLNNYFKREMDRSLSSTVLQNIKNTTVLDEQEEETEIKPALTVANEEEMVIEPQPVRKKMSRQDRYGIRVVDIPMTVTEQINFYVQNNMSFMLHGPSGVGKTARVEQIDPDLTAVPLWNGVLPEDIVGKVRYPDGVEKAATEEADMLQGEWVAPDWYVELTKKCLKEPNKQHVLFIDEVTNARPTTQSLIFHITLKRSISPSKGKLPDNVVVVLAGNSKDESGAAYNMPEPLFRRMCGHIYLKADVQEWLSWGSQLDKNYPEEDRLNIHPLVASFVATYGHKCFYSAYDEENAPKWALDPRGWKQVSDIIYNNNGLIQKELLVAKMGPENATSFMGFAKNPPLTIDDILENSYSASDIPSSADAKLALTLSLRHVYPSELPVVRAFVQRLGRENLNIFDAAWVAGDAERALQLQAAIKSASRSRGR